MVYLDHTCGRFSNWVCDVVCRSDFEMARQKKRGNQGQKWALGGSYMSQTGVVSYELRHHLQQERVFSACHIVLCKGSLHYAQLAGVSTRTVIRVTKDSVKTPLLRGLNDD